MSEQTFLEYVQQQARDLRAGDHPPTSLEDWEQRRTALRVQLIESWGGFPEETCELEPRMIGTLQRDGYTIEKLLLQTRPGIWITANAYVPTKAGPHPAVLCVHGHWSGAKQQPEIQSRCIGLAKLGFFVLVVDAFGAGERGLGKALGEYHGEMVASTLWPTGLSLAGLQVYDNMRAIDYLQSRTEVDGSVIGVTGASGGGNQTMYIGAMDDRLKAVVPVCSVGNYQAYLGAACCMCEVTPGALSYTEEGDVLGLVAPRALMVVSATRDAPQFSVREAAKSIAFAQETFDLHGKGSHIRHAIFDSPHAYNQPMREAMYGWMMLHLKGEGDGSPIPEPAHKTEEPETLRCFPGDSRPDDFVTLPQLAGQEGRRLLQKIGTPNHIDQWTSQEASICRGLSELLGPFPKRTPVQAMWVSDEVGIEDVSFETELGLKLKAARHTAGTGSQRVILLDFDKGIAANNSELAAEFRKQNWTTIALELRATGSMAWKSDKIGRAPDHTTAEWSLWLGRPLLAQWVWDITRLLEALDEHGPVAETTAIVGIGPAGLIALCAASLTTRLDRVATIGSLASFVTDAPYENQRLGTLVPGMLRDVGDVQQIAASVSPRRLIISQPVDGQGATLDPAELFTATRAAYRLEQAAKSLDITGVLTSEQLVTKLQ